jgi:hypothetical protein
MYKILHTFSRGFAVVLFQYVIQHDKLSLSCACAGDPQMVILAVPRGIHMHIHTHMHIHINTYIHTRGL